MSPRQQLSAFFDRTFDAMATNFMPAIVLFMLVPSLLITFVSARYLTRQFTSSRDQYLQATLAIALSEMEQRQLDIRRTAAIIAGEPGMREALRTGDTANLAAKIALFQQQFDKVDYIVLLDRDNRILARSSPNLRYREDGILSEISRMAQSERRAITTNETMPLTDLFVKGSPDYAKFAALLERSMRGRSGPLPQALCEVTTVPVPSGPGGNGPSIGSLVLVGISNSDYYFPDYIASRATEGFLVLTVNGVRVATKSTVGEDQSELIGTPSERLSGNYQGQDGHYGGRLVMDGVPYVFADQPLKNRKGRIVGYISFGLPESRFSGIVTDSRNLSLLLAVVCLFCFAPLVWLVSLRQRRQREALELQVRLRTSELESTVRQLEEADQTKTRFLSNVSHELRTPLSVILNTCEFLKGGYGGPLTDKQLRCINDATECGNHLLSLINDLLDLTRLQAGRKQFRPMAMPLAELIQGCVLEMRSYRPKNDVALTWSLEPGDFCVYADPQLLRQILYNLLSNALKFTTPGCHVTVRARQDKAAGLALLTVEDDGIGIAPEDQERIFLEFEQLENPLTKMTAGTGLGLPIVKKLVELHGGHISVQSAPGKGTAFTFTLPLPDAAPRSAS
ncbi:MAG: ATP-binding protein [Succiniclasticum sp.]|jgi:signal transduction histidine kinase|nr:ATP-binding protein [Succiniclasticum sp.]MCI6222944.1 ATP-binding protein [Selenomonadales bacterium]